MDTEDEILARQKKQKGREKTKRQQQYKRDKAKEKLRSKQRYKKVKNKPDFKKKQQKRRKNPERFKRRSFRDRLVRLAHDVPTLREDLVPLLRSR